MLTDLGIMFSAYLALGRTGAITSSLLLDVGLGTTLGIALLFDLLQIPVYGALLEASSRPSGQRLARWLERRRLQVTKKMAGEGFWGKVAKYHPLAVVAVSTIPVRGCGVMSACILSFMLGYGRVQGTLLIMAGSVIGSLVTLGILFEPIRMFHG